MSPGSEAEDSEKEKTAASHDKESERIPVSVAKAPAKRRTKTGCITCRKRRIKCGEEKPYCKNCIKSKRECAGYVQPLVYKQHNQGGHPVPQDAAEGQRLADHEHFSFNDAIDPGVSHGRGPQGYFNPFGPYPHHGFSSHAHAAVSLPYSQTYPLSASEHSYRPAPPMIFDDRHRRHSVQDQPTHHFAYGGVQYNAGLHRQDSGWSGRQHSFNSSESGMQQYPEISPASNLTSPFDLYTPTSASYVPSDAGHLHDNTPRRYSTIGFVQASPYAAAIPTLSDPRVTLTSSNDDFEDPNDPWDVEMGDQYDDPFSDQQAEEDLKVMLKRKSAYYNGPSIPQIAPQSTASLRAANFSFHTSPLRDERNERIFCHFVEITSRCMTIFERGPTNPWLHPRRTTWSFILPCASMTHPPLAHAMLALAGLHIAKLRSTSEQLPLKHSNQATRRIGRLLGRPKSRLEINTLATVLLLGFYEVMSSDHSRWILHLEGARNLIMEQDFAGVTRAARRMRYWAKQRINQFGQQHVATEMDYVKVAGIPQSLLDDEEWEVDQGVIAALTGFVIDFDRHMQPNHVKIQGLPDLTEKDVADYKTKMDLRWWYCKQDVFQSMVSGDPLLLGWEWWKFCPPRGRLGLASIPHATSDHLLLLLGRLTDFGGKDRSRKIQVVASQGGHWRPPPDTPHSGEFPARNSSADRSSASNSAPSTAQANAPPTQQGPTLPKSKAPAPSANEGRVRQNKSNMQAPSSQGGPPMYGMMPPPAGPVTMPSSFRAMEEAMKDKAFALPQVEMKREPPQRTLEEQTDESLQEHAAISEAFNTFDEALGSEFQPLSNDEGVIQTSPFGPPLRFSSPVIACIWLHYNMGRILLSRLHPHMPPAAMIAAGIAAPQTREYAQNVGKICAGLYQSTPGSTKEPLEPTFAGALIESTFPLLFAGVQYQDISQRGWTIAKLHDIARMTGWQTSAAVAAACEIAWEKQGLAGRGPPYQRSLDRNNKDARVNGASRLIDAGMARVEAVDSETEYSNQFFTHDRNLIGKHGSTRVHWALGLLGVEKDIEKLQLGET